MWTAKDVCEELRERSAVVDEFIKNDLINEMAKSSTINEASFSFEIIKVLLPDLPLNRVVLELQLRGFCVRTTQTCLVVEIPPQEEE